MVETVDTLVCLDLAVFCFPIAFFSLFKKFCFRALFSISLGKLNKKIRADNLVWENTISCLSFFMYVLVRVRFCRKCVEAKLQLMMHLFSVTLE